MRYHIANTRVRQRLPVLEPVRAATAAPRRPTSRRHGRSLACTCHFRGEAQVAGIRGQPGPGYTQMSEVLSPPGKRIS